jgi:hypothetical protein
MINFASLMSGPILQNLISQVVQPNQTDLNQENLAQSNPQEGLPIPLFQQEPVNSQDALIAALSQNQMQQLNEQPGQLIQPVQNGEIQPPEMVQQETVDLQSLIEMLTRGSMGAQSPLLAQSNPFETFRKSIVPAGFMQRLF